MAKPKAGGPVLARRFLISGRVQGVGFRWFVERVANEVGVTGWTRNLGDGRVEVYATGTVEKLNELSGYLWKGPRGAQVRGVEELEAPVQEYSDFRIEYFS